MPSFLGTGEEDPFQLQHETIGIVSVLVVPREELGSPEAHLFIQTKGTDVVILRFEVGSRVMFADHLVDTSDHECFGYGLPEQSVGTDSPSPVRGKNGQHADVPKRLPIQYIFFADADADQLALLVACLG